MYDYPTHESMTRHLSFVTPQLSEMKNEKDFETFQDVFNVSKVDLNKIQYNKNEEIKIGSNPERLGTLENAPRPAQDKESTDTQILPKIDAAIEEPIEYDRRVIPADAQIDPVRDINPQTTQATSTEGRDTKAILVNASSTPQISERSEGPKETTPRPQYSSGVETGQSNDPKATVAILPARPRTLFTVPQAEGQPAPQYAQAEAKDPPIKPTPETPIMRPEPADNAKLVNAITPKKEKSSQGLSRALEHGQKPQPPAITQMPPAPGAFDRPTSAPMEPATQLTEPAALMLGNPGEVQPDEPKSSNEGSGTERATTIHRASIELTARAVQPMQVDPRAVIQQISASLTSSAAGQIEITLSPEELGQVRLQLTQQDGRALMIVAADRAETLDLLRRNADMLLSDFAQMGYDGLDLQFRDQPSQSGHDEDAADEASLDADPAPSLTVAPPKQYILPDRLDLRL